MYFTAITGEDPAFPKDDHKLSASYRKSVFQKYGLVWHMLSPKEPRTPHKILQESEKYYNRFPESYAIEELTIGFITLGLHMLCMIGLAKWHSSIWDPGFEIELKKEDGCQ